MSNPAIKAELRKIAKANKGVLLPEKVVDAARAEKSPLHSWFEWNDDEAAEQYRLWQARQLIRVTVEIIDCGNGGKEACVFVSLSTDRVQGGYREFTAVMSNKEMRAQLLRDALGELNLFERKYRELKELAAVFTAARKVRDAA